MGGWTKRETERQTEKDRQTDRQRDRESGPNIVVLTGLVVVFHLVCHKGSHYKYYVIHFVCH